MQPPVRNHSLRLSVTSRSCDKNQEDFISSNEVRQISSHENQASLDDKASSLSSTMMTAQEPTQESDDQSNVPVILNRLGDFGFTASTKELITAIVVPSEQHFIDKFCKFIQKKQERTLRRDAFRAWGKFAVDMAAEKRLCNIVQAKQERTLRRGVFRAWRLGKKNQIEALETEIETLNERVHMLEQQKTGQPDIDHIASELAKRGLLVSNKSQNVQQTAAAQSHVTEQHESKGFFASLSLNPFGSRQKKTSPSVSPPPPEPNEKPQSPLEPETKTEQYKTPLQSESESDVEPKSESESEPETEPQSSPLSSTVVLSPPAGPPLSGNAPPPPPPPGSGLPRPQGVLPATNMSDTPVMTVSRLPRQKEKSSQNAPQMTGISAVQEAQMTGISAVQEAQMTGISAIQEAQFKALMRHERNGENLRCIIDADKYDETIRAYNAYKARNTSTDAVAPRKRVLSEKSQKISADIEAQKKIELERANPRTLIGQRIKKKFHNSRAASSGDEASSGFSTSDNEQNSVSIEKELSIVVEPKGTAEQETPTKEDNVKVFSMLSLLLDDNMPLVDTDSKTSDDGDDEELDFCFYAPTSVKK